MTKESDQFEKELEDFFQDRALLRTASVSDPTKKIVKQTRNEDEKITFLESQQTRPVAKAGLEQKQVTQKDLKPQVLAGSCEGDLSPFRHDPNMSGCCMTGCHDCPWGFQA